jgi:hypothetical protein
MGSVRDVARFLWRIAVIAFLIGLVIGLALGFRVGESLPFLAEVVPRV